MRKKYLSRILLGGLIIASTVTLNSCKDYDDDIDDLQEQIDENAAAISANATAIDALEAEISAGSVISSVTTTSGGITITLSNGSSYDITNGEDGADGSVISINEDGYWCIDNVSTGLLAEGQDGTTGEDGTDGGFYYPNTATYTFWYVSGEEAEALEDTDIAYLSENNIGTNTEISFLSENTTEVTMSVSAIETDDYVMLVGVLVDGEATNITIYKDNKLRSLVFIPQVYVDGVEGLTYGQFTYTAVVISDKNSTDGETWSTSETETIINPTVQAQYHVNPSTATITADDVISIVLDADVDFITSRTASDNLSITATFADYTDGILTVNLDITGTEATEELISVFALQVTKVNDDETEETVTSDYATIYNEDLDELAIARDDLVETDDLYVDGDHHYRTYVNDEDSEAYITTNIWESTDPVSDNCDLSVVYTGSIDLADYVVAHKVADDADCTTASAEYLESLGLEFVYEVYTGYYIGDDALTPQSEFVTLEGSVFTPRVYTTTGAASINRTPIIRVTLVDTNNDNAIVSIAYLKVYIAAEEEEDESDYTYEFPVDAFAFSCGEEGSQILDVETFNVNVYNELGLSKEEFHSKYAYFYDYGATLGEIGTVTETEEDALEATWEVTWTITEDDLWTYAGSASITHTIRFYTDSEYTGNYVELILTSSIDGVQKTYNIETADYISNMWNDDYTLAKFNVSVPTSTTDDDEDNCLFINDLNSPFTTWPTNSTTGVPGVLQLDEAVTSISYYFCEDIITDITQVGDIDVVFSVSSDGTELYATVDGTTETIATIDNTGATTSTLGDAIENAVELNKDSDIAKALLNTEELDIYFGATGNVCDDESKVVTITFNGEDHFVARYIRPVFLNSEAADNFIDGVDYEEDGSIIAIEDLIDPYDWRDRYFSDYDNYWDYYGISGITIDVDDAICTINDHTVDDEFAVPTNIVLTQVDVTTIGTEETLGTKTSAYGFLTYKNNGTKVETGYYIYVTVTVEYTWGTIESDPIAIWVEPTISNK